MKKTFCDWLTVRYQLVVRNEDNLAEEATFCFSYAKLIVLTTFLFTALVACSVTLSNTILAYWLNPAYIERENQNKVAKLAVALEELETQNKEQEQFISLLQSIIAGKEVDREALSAATASTMSSASSQSASTSPGTEDAARSKQETSTAPVPATAYQQKDSELQEVFLFSPINGIITTPFKKKAGHYGVDIVAKEQAPIKCVADGIVVLAEYTLETGWVIIVQHCRNLVSVYKHNASVFKKVGSFVKAGEVIAIMGNSGTLSSGPHLHFELWHGGKAIDPEDFIAF
ncbi:MAG: M23 family metallopeptidase [Bacteroidota bacterium]